MKIDRRRYPGTRRLVGGGCAAALLIYFSSFSGLHAKDEAKAEGAVATRMQNVMFHFTTTSAVHIKTLRGEIVPTGKNAYPIFDDKESFRVRVSGAEITISATDLASVLNSYVFAQAKSPLKLVTAEIMNGKLRMKGKLHDKGDIPFESDGVLSATPDGKIRLHTEKIKALKVPVKGLMDTFGIDIAKLISSGKLAGVQAEGNDLILNIAEILPAPHLDGKVTAIHLEGENIVLIFGTVDGNVKKGPAGNYMSYRGNRLQFGKLLMSDADMTLIDMDSGDPLDFYLDHYKEQLMAGYSKITPSFGLKVFVRDFDKLGKGRAGKEAEEKPASRN